MNYEEHLVTSDTCVVAFASDGGRNFIPDVPDYEFGHSLHRLGCSYVLMRDTPERWYTQGIEGLGDNDEVARYIWNLGERYAKVITTGVSFGAWGALMYGQMAPADEIIVYSPLTVIGKAAHEDFDEKWHHRVDSDKSLDLKPLFEYGSLVRIRAFVSDGDGAELDHKMASRLGITDITVIPGHSHGGLARHMRDNGWFERLYKL